MEKKISDMMDMIQDASVNLNEIDKVSAEHVKEVTMNKIKESKKNKFRMPRWAAAAVAIICITLVGGVGYAANKYPEIFAKYFGKEETEMMGEMITSEPLMKENENYRLTVESTFFDEDLKWILVSIEALNDESWKVLKEISRDGLWGPGLSTTIDTNATIYSQEELSNEAERKYYFSYRLQARYLDECHLYFAPIELHDKLSVLHNKICTLGEGIPEDYLEIVVPLTGTTSQQTIEIQPENCMLNKEIQVQKVMINRMNISILADIPKAGISYDEIVSDSVTVMRKLNILDPEVIVEMEDGKRICILTEVESEIVDGGGQMWPINETTRRNGLFYIEGSSYIMLNYEFAQIFDIEGVEKIRIDGVEYPVMFSK